MKLSTNEKNFIKKNLISRIGKRNNEEERKVLILNENHIPQADASILISKDESILEISIKLKENKFIIDKILEIDTEEVIKNEKMIELQGDFSEMEEFGFSDFLRENQLYSLVIETKILNDDGNMIGLFYEGINKLVLGINQSVKGSDANISDFIVPLCKTFAVFDDAFVCDPDKVEEESADAIVKVFTRNESIMKVCADKCRKLDPYVLSEILNNF